MKTNLQTTVRLILLCIVLGFAEHALAQMTPVETAKLSALQKQLEGRNAQYQSKLAREASRLGYPLRISSQQGELVLRSIENEQPIYDGNFNLNSVQTISADDVKAGGSLNLGLTGAGITLGIWEAFEPGSRAAVRTTHQEFGGRATQMDGAPNFSSHATHVAGTMIASGVDANAEGFSTGADLACYDLDNDLAEMAAAAAATPPVLVSNHSYGSFAGWDTDNMGNWVFYGGSNNEDWKFGAYNDQARDWDNVAHNAPFLVVVKSAGNDRNDGPGMNVNHTHAGSATIQNDSHEDDGGPDDFDCIPTYGNAKNIVTVGAVNNMPGGYSGPASVTLAGFSGFGPSDDGRIKPDVVADGVSLYSSDRTADDEYTTKSGTSMSSPLLQGPPDCCWSTGAM
ncbi:MAG: S8 family serine peptidase [Lewinellaceae bacterium]|nr:S8 family serine peptidase [Lewinellaceae bacterium]